MNKNNNFENNIKLENEQSSCGEEIKQLSHNKPNLLFGLSMFILNILLIFTGILLSNIFTPDKQFILFLLALVVSSLFIATRLRAMSMILHDAIHFNICKSKKQNIIFGRIVSVFLPFSFDSYRYTHALHHKFLGEPERDPDFNYEIQYFLFNHKIQSKESATLFKGILKNVISYLNYSIWDDREPFFWRSLRIILHLIIISYASYEFNYFLISKLFLIIYFFTFPLIRFLGDSFDHGELVANGSILKTRNQTGHNKITNFLLFPLNDQYHLVHHIYPNISAPQLKHAHSILLSSSKTYSLLHQSKQNQNIVGKLFVSRRQKNEI